MHVPLFISEQHEQYIEMNKIIGKVFKPMMFLPETNKL